jgi:hypothetical protein
MINFENDELNGLKFGQQYFINHGDWHLHVDMVEKIQWGRSEPRPAVKILLQSEESDLPVYMFVYNHKGTLCIEFQRVDKVRCVIPYGEIESLPKEPYDP